MERPKHFGEGAKSGALAALAGVGAGLASLIVLPVQGAREGGAKGAAVGVAKGVGAAIGLSALGVGAGVVQVVRGATNTPAAVLAKVAGKEWDKHTRRWVLYNLREEGDLVLNMGEVEYLEYIFSEGMSANAASAEPKTTGGYGGDSNAPPLAGEGKKAKTGSAEAAVSVKETGLYDTLDVAPGASAGQIKKSYYKLAKQYHPDKNPDDARAKERFQEISNAYQVLSDDALRAKYDKGGRAGLDEEPKMDAKAFYTMMFGSEEFEMLIGKMHAISLISAEDDELKVPDGVEPEVFESAHVELNQWKREVTCAMNLVDLLRPFVSGEVDEAAFKSSVGVLGAELSSSAVGGALTGLIGYCYKQQAVRALGLQAVDGGVCHRASACMAHAENKAYQYKTYANLGVATVSAASAAGALASEQKKLEAQGREAEEDSEKERKMSVKAEAHAQRAATKMVEAMWHGTVIEIDGLLRQVCKKVTHDTAVEKDVRKLRAQGLIIVGEAFLAYGVKIDSGLQELVEKLGAASG